MKEEKLSLGKNGLLLCNMICYYKGEKWCNDLLLYNDFDDVMICYCRSNYKIIMWLIGLLNYYRLLDFFLKTDVIYYRLLDWTTIITYYKAVIWYCDWTIMITIKLLM